MQKFEAPGTLLPLTLTATAKGAAAVAARIIQNKSRTKRNKQIKMEEDEPRMQPRTCWSFPGSTANCNVPDTLPLQHGEK